MAIRFPGLKLEVPRHGIVDFSFDHSEETLFAYLLPSFWTSQDHFCILAESITLRRHRVEITIINRRDHGGVTAREIISQEFIYSYSSNAPTSTSQLEWPTSLYYRHWSASSETLTQSDFLGNSMWIIILGKVNRRLMEYLAVIRPRALVAQEEDIDHAEAQEVTIKKSIDEPVSYANGCENGHRVLIKVGKILAPPQVLVPPQSQSPLEAKAIKAPNSTVSPYHSALVI